MNIDLHCHSTNSDGTWSVSEILVDAERKGVKVLAISDHDNLKGSREAFEKKGGLFSGQLIPAIEISTLVEGKKVHLLAFFPTIDISPESDLLQSLDKIQNSRIWRMKKMIEKDNAIGFDITFEEVLEAAGTGKTGDKQPTDVISRPHLARVLVDKGYVKDFNEAFNEYLADGKAIQVNRFTLKFTDWIQQVKALGGIMIWAHPLHGHEGKKESFLELAEILKDSDIDGVERIYNYKGKYIITDEFESWGQEQLDMIIAEKDWLITAGGDFHGDVGRLGELDLPADDWKRFESKLFG